MKKTLIIILLTLSPLLANVPDHIADAALENCDTQAIVTTLALDNITKESLEEAIKKAKYNLQRAMSLEDLMEERKCLETFLLLKEAYGIKYPDASDNQYYQTLKQHLGNNRAMLSKQRNTNALLADANALLADTVESLGSLDQVLSKTNTNSRKIKELQKDTNAILYDILLELQSIKRRMDLTL